MRINKYIAQAGVASRREADRLVEQGKVKVNGAVMKEPGFDVSEDDVVTVNGKVIQGAEKLEYYLINKPVGVITAVTDDRDRPTVSGIVDTTARLFPVGRLDYNTSGALIMTNDGNLSYRLTHPKHGIFKTYHAVVQGAFSEERGRKLEKGVDIGGYVTQPAHVRILKIEKNRSVVEIAISEGKYHQVRKMFKAVGNPVLELERIAIGDIRLGRLLSGGYRKLTREEVEYLKNV